LFKKHADIEIAKELKMSHLKSVTKTVLIDQLINFTVGARLIDNYLKSKSEK
jgi:hypothetical protein